MINLFGMPIPDDAVAAFLTAAASKRQGEAIKLRIGNLNIKF